MAVRIRNARFPQDNHRILALFAAYAESLGIDLTFQNFDDELASFPGKYTPQEGGALIVAELHSDSSRSTVEASEESPAHNIVGCVALRRNTDTWCEMKRLYVTPQARKTGAGQKLVQEIIQQGCELGYEGMRLDTLSHMVPALTLYRRFGFEEIEKYYETPLEGTVFMGLRL